MVDQEELQSSIAQVGESVDSTIIFGALHNFASSVVFFFFFTENHNNDK